MIEVKSISKSFGGRKVVRSVSLEIEHGEIVGLLGPNGAGKTTSFYMIIGLLRPDAGAVFLDGKDISHTPMYKRSRLGLGYLPQEPSIFKKLTVMQNLTVIWETLKLIPRDQYESEAKRLLDEMGVWHLRNELGFQLSGGEKRRVEIARALAVNPSFLLLDEPFAGIDPIAVSEIQEIIRDLSRSGLGIMITDHNVRETLAITDRSYIIHDGKLLLSGDPQKIVNDPIAKRFYLGEDFSL